VDEDVVVNMTMVATKRPDATRHVPRDKPMLKLIPPSLFPWLWSIPLQLLSLLSLSLSLSLSLIVAGSPTLCLSLTFLDHPSPISGRAVPPSLTASQPTPPSRTRNGPRRPPPVLLVALGPPPRPHLEPGSTARPPPWTHATAKASAPRLTRHLLRVLRRSYLGDSLGGLCVSALRNLRQPQPQSTSCGRRSCSRSRSDHAPRGQAESR
jgi:hypothetical protein